MTTKEHKGLAQERIMKAIAVSLSGVLATDEDGEYEAVLEQAARVGRLFGYESFTGLGTFVKPPKKLLNNYELDLS